MIEQLQAALVMLSSGKVLLTVALCSLYGLFVGAIPGLTATMAAALVRIPGTPSSAASSERWSSWSLRRCWPRWRSGSRG